MAEYAARRAEPIEALTVDTDCPTDGGRLKRVTSSNGSHAPSTSYATGNHWAQEDNDHRASPSFSVGFIAGIM